MVHVWKIIYTKAAKKLSSIVIVAVTFSRCRFGKYIAFPFKMI